jgi:hypothetical protein
MPAKAGIQVREIPGFRVAILRENEDHASLPGMTIDLCNDFLGQDTS